VERGGFEANSKGASLGGGPWQIFPKSVVFLIILKLMIFSRNFLNLKAGQFRDVLLMMFITFNIYVRNVWHF
jgi:hypothetical protein